MVDKIKTVAGINDLCEIVSPDEIKKQCAAWGELLSYGTIEKRKISTSKFTQDGIELDTVLNIINTVQHGVASVCIQFVSFCSQLHKWSMFRYYLWWFVTTSSNDNRHHGT